MTPLDLWHLEALREDLIRSVPGRVPCPECGGVLLSTYDDAAGPLLQCTGCEWAGRDDRPE